jgi:hypothetical protein
VQVGVTPSVAWLAVVSGDGGNSLPSWMPSHLLWSPRSGSYLAHGASLGSRTSNLDIASACNRGSRMVTAAIRARLDHDTNSVILFRGAAVPAALALSAAWTGMLVRPSARLRHVFGTGRVDAVVPACPRRPRPGRLARRGAQGRRSCHRVSDADVTSRCTHSGIGRSPARAYSWVGASLRSSSAPTGPPLGHGRASPSRREARWRSTSASLLARRGQLPPRRTS